MEGLHQQARKQFDRSYFQPSPDVYQTITITPASDLALDFTYEESHESVNAAFAGVPSDRTDVIQPALKLMKFDKDHETFYATKEHLLKAIELCEIEPYMLYLLSCWTRGFHYFQDDASRLGFGCYYINNGAFVLIWTHDIMRCSTKAIVVRRQTFGSHEANNEFRQELCLYRSLAHDPLSLAFVSSYRLASHVDKFTQEQQYAVCDVEKATTFSPWYLHREPTVGTKRIHLAEMSRMSQKMGAALIALAETARQSEVIRRVNYFILSSQETEWVSHLRPELRTSAEKNRKSIREAVMILQSQIESEKLDIEYVQKRAQNQLGVFFNLIARSDTQATIELAESSKHDSTSMKTIAIMTMVFLPGTFFAALFAVPSLKWDAEPVIQRKFWIYWAFSLPSTALIFVIWSLIDKWKLMRNRLLKFNRKSNESDQRTLGLENGQKTGNPQTQQGGAHEKGN